MEPFSNEYLQKEPDREVLSNTWDSEKAKDYFPTQQVQEAIMAKSKQSGLACPRSTRISSREIN
jgi:hypothetical protein